MLRNSFIHIPGIGKITEKHLWQSGLIDWETAYSAAVSGGVPGQLAEKLKRYVPESIKALSRGDIGFFNRILLSGESWRFYPELRNKCVFLDIETTGLSPFFDQITVVGLYDGVKYKAFVKGRQLEEFIEELSKYAMVVTFNGSLFDLRFIKTHFHKAPVPPVHVDLRFLARRLGLVGGLKIVERKLGIRRQEDIQRLSGYDATVLWSRYARGDKASLELLIKYNMQDVISLQTILDIGFEKLRPKGRRFQKNNKASANATKDLAAQWKRCEAESTISQSFFNSSPDKTRKSDIVSRLVRKVTNGRPAKIVGIDLTGSSKRASGWAFISGDNVNTKLLRTDEEIIDETLLVKPDLVSIDSPLTLPTGYPRHQVIYRQCERALKRLGISVFWCLLPSMQGLTMRGIKLAQNFRQKGIHVIESYPGAAQDVLLIPRKKASTEELKWGLVRAGFKGSLINHKLSHDELDAITSAFVGLFYLADEYIALGNGTEDYLIIPRTPRMKTAFLIKRLSSSVQVDLDLFNSTNAHKDRKSLEVSSQKLLPSRE